MKKLTKKESEDFSKYGTMKFDSIKLYKSKNGKLFFIVRCGLNSMFISEGLLKSIKEAA